jgi:hypothetical protein
MARSAATVPWLIVQHIAQAQDALIAMRQPLADKIKLYVAIETIPVATDCPICKGNVGA